MTTNQFGNQTAAAMKGDIVSALSIALDKVGDVSVQDFSNSRPIAIIQTEYIDSRLIGKMDGLGWELSNGHTKTSSKLITLIFSPKRETE